MPFKELTLEDAITILESCDSVSNSLVRHISNMLSIRKGNSTSSVEIGRLVFLDSYMNTPLKMLLEGNIYYLNFITGTYYIT